MINVKKLILTTLKEYNQEHLLQFWHELNIREKVRLFNEIKQVDFKFMHQLYKNSYFDEKLNINEIKPLKCITKLTKEEKQLYNNIGKKIIMNNQYGVVILAGGSASRLGLGLPKGCLEINLNNKKISLFELYINQLKKIKKEYGIYLNIYIMTSFANNDLIINFFKENDYFNYPKENINFFCQGKLPILDTNGNVLLKEKNQILFGPNGNGNVFESLKNSGIIKELKNKNIKYLLFSTIDNVLTNLVDLNFIGSMIENNYELASKTISKQSENEKDWIFCKYMNKPFMLPTNYINNSITNKKNSNGDYLYREKNITYHLISINLIEKISTIDLKYHRAYKKNDYISIDGNLIKSEKPNTFKFEQFIFDAFYYADDMLLYRVDENEFCPIKNFEDIEKAEKKLSSRNLN